MDITSFKKNHPKNAIGYLLALQSDADTEDVFKRYVISSVDDSRRDAMGLGFVQATPETYRVTERGHEAVRTIVYHHGSVNSALAAIDDQSGRAARFIDVLPVMGVVTRQALLEYQPTTVLLKTLDSLAGQGDTSPSLATVAKTIARRRPTFALNFFVAPDDRDDIRESGSGEIDLETFDNGMIYSTHTTFQYKAMLYHTGILTTRGNDTKEELDPTSAVWALEDPLNPFEMSDESGDELEQIREEFSRLAEQPESDGSSEYETFPNQNESVTNNRIEEHRNIKFTRIGGEDLQHTFSCGSDVTVCGISIPNDSLVSDVPGAFTPHCDECQELVAAGYIYSGQTYEDLKSRLESEIKILDLPKNAPESFGLIELDKIVWHIDLLNKQIEVADENTGKEDLTASTDTQAESIDIMIDEMLGSDLDEEVRIIISKILAEEGLIENRQKVVLKAIQLLKSGAQENNHDLLRRLEQETGRDNMSYATWWTGIMLPIFQKLQEENIVTRGKYKKLEWVEDIKDEDC